MDMNPTLDITVAAIVPPELKMRDGRDAYLITYTMRHDDGDNWEVYAKECLHCGVEMPLTQVPVYLLTQGFEKAKARYISHLFSDYEASEE